MSCQSFGCSEAHSTIASICSATSRSALESFFFICAEVSHGGVRCHNIPQFTPTNDREVRRFSVDAATRLVG